MHFVPVRSERPTPRLVLAIVCLATATVVMDNTVLNVALPALARDLQLKTSSLQWVVDSYAVVFASFVLLGGALCDRLGSRRVFCIGLVTFAGGSATAAGTDGIGALIACRGVTGFGASLVFPATLSLLSEHFTGPGRTRAIGLWTAMAGVGVALGPLVGGVLVDSTSWRTVFLINVPIVAVCLIGGMRGLPPTSIRSVPLPNRLDALLCAGGFGALILAVIDAPAHAWTSARTGGTFALAGLLLGAFVARQARSARPLVAPALLRGPMVQPAMVSMTVAFFAFFGALFLLTQQLQGAFGYNAFKAGLATSPAALALLVASPLSSRLAERLGTHRVLPSGLLLAAVGTAAWACSAASNYRAVAGSLAMLSFGIGLVVPTATAIVMEATSLQDAGVRPGVNDVCRQLGGALGVAVSGSVASWRVQSGTGRLTDAGTSGEPLLSGFGQARFADGLQLAMVVLSVVLLLTSLVTARLMRPPRTTQSLEPQGELTQATSGATVRAGADDGARQSRRR